MLKLLHGVLNLRPNNSAWTRITGNVWTQLRGRYIADIKNKVERNWIRPASARSSSSCKVAVSQIPGGEVVNVTVTQCIGDDVFLRSVEAAVYKASPLPRPSDPALFERQILFNFKPKK